MFAAPVRFGRIKTIGTNRYGPRVDRDDQGKCDLFQDYARKVFLRAGCKQIRVADSTLYHNAGGSIHCGTNANRKIPLSLWWQGNLA